MSKVSLKEARKAKGMSQKGLAETLGTSQVYVSDLEIGKQSPSETMRKTLKEIFGDVSYPRDEISGNEVRKIVSNGTAVVPLFRTMVSAGKKGTPILEDSQEEFDVAEHYRNTCVYEVSGDSMIDSDIEEGDRVVVKLGYRFANRDIILCRYNGELMVKGAAIVDNVIWLFPANDHIHPWRCKDSDEFQCMGTVVEVIKNPHTEWWKKHNFNKLK